MQVVGMTYAPLGTSCYDGVQPTIANFMPEASHAIALAAKASDDEVGSR
jgi:hypothetical protein